MSCLSCAGREACRQGCLEENESCALFFLLVPSLLFLSAWEAQAALPSHVSSCSNFPSIFVYNLGKQLSLLMPSVKTPVLCAYVPASFAQEKRWAEPQVHPSTQATDLLRDPAQVSRVHFMVSLLLKRLTMFLPLALWCSRGVEW